MTINLATFLAPLTEPLGTHLAGGYRECAPLGGTENLACGEHVEDWIDKTEESEEVGDVRIPMRFFLVNSALAISIRRADWPR